MKVTNRIKAVMGYKRDDWESIKIILPSTSPVVCKKTFSREWTGFTNDASTLVDAPYKR